MPKRPSKKLLAFILVSITLFGMVVTAYTNELIGAAGNPEVTGTTITKEQGGTLASEMISDDAEPSAMSLRSSEIIEFKDRNLEQWIADALDKTGEPITMDDALKFDELSLPNEQIKDITGLRYFINLTELDLDGNEISDISELAYLTKLEYLFLSGNQIQEIGALKNLVSLETLLLNYNRISDISPLANLTNLTTLYLCGNSISDINVLANLINLFDLNIAENRIRDISALKELPHLYFLDVKFNYLDLTDGSISMNIINDFILIEKEVDYKPQDEPLVFSDVGLEVAVRNALNLPTGDIISRHVSYLTNLDAKNRSIENIDDLKYFDMLISLDLEGNKISDIDILKNLEELQNLNLSNNDIIDINSLRNLSNLTILDLTMNYIDISAGSEAMNIIASLSERINAANLKYSPQKERPKVEIPKADIASGSTVQIGSELKLSSGTSGATIRYTTDGTTPTTSSAQYEDSNPIKINSEMTIKAIAFKDGMLASDMATFTYKIEIEISVVDVTLNKSELTMFVGDTQTLEATVSPSQASNKAVSWTSLNESVAKVSQEGIVEAISPGTAKIKVITQDGKKEAVCDVTVVNDPNLIVFNDLALESAVRTALDIHSGPITIDDAINLKTLNAGGLAIENISSLNYFTNLTELSLPYNNIKSLDGLNTLTNLEYLNIRNNEIEDISPLSNLINLTELNLANNSISDISPLSNLVELTQLFLFGNDIENISPLANLTDLIYLNLSYNNITYINPLTALDKLTGLLLSDNNIEDINALANLTELTELYLSGNNLTEINPLSNLTNLIELFLDNNKINNISALTALSGLMTLDLRFNYINISPNSSAMEVMNALINTYVTYEPQKDAETVATPTANILYEEVAIGTEVELICSTQDATIRYTTDGSTPTNLSDIYTSPIIITSDTTQIKAVAYKAGMITSDMAEFAYTIKTITNGVSVRGKIKTYNPNNPTTLRLLIDGAVKYEIEISGYKGYGRIEQEFEFTDVLPGTYTLEITKLAHTKFTVKNIVVDDVDVDLTQDGRDTVKLMVLRCGDINGSGSINDGDLTVLWLSGNYSKSVANGANPLADLDGNGSVNDGDLTILWSQGNYSKGAVVIE